MLISANFFTRAIARIVEGAGDPMWWTSQAFALVAFVCFIWGWQIKNKIRMMFLVGIASAALAVSASLVENWSLGALFGLAAVRNFVFCTLDWYDSVTKRVTGKGNGCAEWTKTQNPKVLNMFKTKQPLPSWLRYMFAGFFAVATVTITTLFLTVPALLEKVPFFAEANTYIMVGREKVWQTHIVPIEGAILEIGICLTLLGLILGNILSGTKLMRSSFVANRLFNIVNHFYFANLISVLIAITAIGSNVVYFARNFPAWLRKKRGLEPIKAGAAECEKCAVEPEQKTSGQPFAENVLADCECCDDQTPVAVPKSEPFAENFLADCECCDDDKPAADDDFEIIEEK